MKKVNLRKYYPYYTQDVMVEVPDEIADLLKELTRSEDAYRIRTYRYKAVYSLELMNELRELPADGPLPEEILEQDDMIELLYEGLRSLPDKQRSRIIAYYFLGMSKVDIAKSEDSDESTVRESLQGGIHTLGKFFQKNLI